jgi:hypothetical protein
MGPRDPPGKQGAHSLCKVTYLELLDFPVIPLGELNILKRIGSGDGSGVVGRRRGRASVKRLYSARIHGSNSGMTAAMYQGDGAEEVRLDLYC